MGYVPGSHRGEVEFVDIFTKPGSGEALVAKQAAEPVFVPCKPGDVIFHHGRTVHLAKPNRSDRMRRVYTAIYFKDGCTRGDRAPAPFGGSRRHPGRRRHRRRGDAGGLAAGRRRLPGARTLAGRQPAP